MDDSANIFGLLRLSELHIEFMLNTKMKKKQLSRMLIQNLFQLIVTDYSAMHCYYSCGLPNCLTSKVSKLAQNWGSKWPWYAIIVIFLHYWRTFFFVLWPGRRSSWCVTYLRNGILLPILFWPTVRKNCSSDEEKVLKSLEQFILTVIGHYHFW